MQAQTLRYYCCCLWEKTFCSSRNTFYCSHAHRRTHTHTHICTHFALPLSSSKRESFRPLLVSHLILAYYPCSHIQSSSKETSEVWYGRCQVVIFTVNESSVLSISQSFLPIFRLYGLSDRWEQFWRELVHGFILFSAFSCNQE